MKIYTKTGDLGDTGLLGGVRVRKDHPRIEAYGTVDELNAVLGVARAAGLPAGIDQVLARVQHELFELGAELARPTPLPADKIRLDGLAIERLEQAIDAGEATLPPLMQFILPGGSASAASLHLARTVCRRAERRILTLGHQPGESIRSEVVVYLNRLSDLLFVLARVANHEAGTPDVPWERL